MDADGFVEDDGFAPDPGQKAHAYPGPKAVSSEELGLSAPPRKDAIVDIWTDPADQLAVQNLSPVERDLMIQKLNQAGKEFLANVGGQVAASAAVPVIGEAAAGVAGKAAASKVASSAPNALSAFAKAGAKKTTGDLVKGALAATAKHLSEKAMGETGSELAGRAANAVASKAGGAIAAAAPPVARAVAAPVGGAMGNQIERLRASAVGNPRAAELMTKIDAILQSQSPEFTPGTATQSTLGGEQ